MSTVTTALVLCRVPKIWALQVHTVKRADCWEKEILQQTTHRLKLSTKSRVGGIQVTTSFPFHTPREIQSPSQTQNVGVGRIYKIRSIGDWAEIPR